MDNDNTNSPETTETQETPVAETPQDVNETETTAPVQETAETTELGVDFVQGVIGEELGELATPELLNECADQLKAIGITDKGMAERALNYVITARNDFMRANRDETLAHFGSTTESFTPEYAKALSEAQVTMNVLESKVKGIKETINRAGIQGDLRLVLTLQKLYPLLCEDRNLMNGGVNSTAPKKSDADIIFGKIKPIGELNNKE